MTATDPRGTSAYPTKRAWEGIYFWFPGRVTFLNQTGLMIFGWLWMPAMQWCSDFRHRSSCTTLKRNSFSRKQGVRILFFDHSPKIPVNVFTALAGPGPDSRQTFRNCSWGAREKYRTSGKSCKWGLSHVHEIQLCKGQKTCPRFVQPIRVIFFPLGIGAKFCSKLEWSSDVWCLFPLPNFVDAYCIAAPSISQRIFLLLAKLW